MPPAKKSFKPKQDVVVTVDGEDYGAIVTKFTDPHVFVKYENDEKGKVHKKDVTDLKVWEKKNAEKEEEEKKETKESDSLEVDDDLDNAIFDDDDSTKDNATTEDDDSVFDDATETTDAEDPILVELAELDSLKALKGFRDDNSLDVKIIRGVEVDDLREELRDAYIAEHSDDGTAGGGEPATDLEKDTKGTDTIETEPDAGSDSWFAEGDEQDEAFKDDRSKGTYRFSLKQDEEADIVILTEKPLTYKEHNLRMAGKWGNTFTCIMPGGTPCPICEAGKNAATKKAFYVLDTRSFKSKDGKKTYKNQVRVMAMTGTSYKVLKKIVAKHFKGTPDFSYKGLLVTAMRSDADKSPGTGDIFTINKKVKIKDEWLKSTVFEGETVSFDLLKKEVAPLTREKLAGKVKWIQADDD